MATFQPGTEIETSEPTVEVTVTASQPITPGAHSFQLIVVDDAGNKSEPMVVRLVVRDTQRPTAVLIAPEVVEFGQSFVLDGRRSSDVPPGRVVRFVWTMVS
jgi:hypothetical protein